MNSKDKVYVFDNIKYLLKTNWGIDISDFDLSELLLDTAFIFQISKWITNLRKIEREKE